MRMKRFSIQIILIFFGLQVHSQTIVEQGDAIKLKTTNPENREFIWQSSTDSINWTNISGSNNQSEYFYTIPSGLQNATKLYFRAKVLNVASCLNFVSNIRYLVLNDKLYKGSAWYVNNSNEFSIIGIHKDSSMVAIKTDTISNSINTIVFKGKPDLPEFTVSVDANGYPSKVYINDNIYLFSNYTSNTVDVALISSEGKISIFKSIVNDKIPLLKKTSLKSAGGIKASEIIEWAGIGLSVVSCGISVVTASPVAIAYTCGSVIVDVMGKISPYDDKIREGIALSNEAWGLISGGAGCLEKKPLECVGFLTSIAAKVTADAEDYFSKNAQNITIANNSLKSNMKVYTNSITTITTNSAVSGGFLESAGNATIIKEGVCWSTSSNPTLSNYITIDGPGLTSFTSSITNLYPNTTYYVRAYVTISEVTIYGDQKSFTTDQLQSPVTVSTTNATNITSSSATCGGNIIKHTQWDITARGVCWNTYPSPTINSYKTNDGNGEGSFTSSIINLSPNTKYYVRAYAISSEIVYYGNEVTFTTTSGSGTSLSITTSSVSNITSNSATCGGNITNSGTSTITTHGICWSTTPDPTFDNSYITNDGTGAGSFTSSLTGLNADTKYYVRAYAITPTQVYYGNEVNFTTITSTTPIPSDSSAFIGSFTLVIDGQTINYNYVFFSDYNGDYSSICGWNNSYNFFVIYHSQTLSVGNYNYNINCGDLSLIGYPLHNTINLMFDNVFWMSELYCTDSDGIPIGLSRFGSLNITSYIGKTLIGAFSAILYNNHDGTNSKSISGSFNITKQ